MKEDERILVRITSESSSYDEHSLVWYDAVQGVRLKHVASGADRFYGRGDWDEAIARGDVIVAADQNSQKAEMDELRSALQDACEKRSDALVELDQTKRELDNLRQINKVAIGTLETQHAHSWQGKVQQSSSERSPMGDPCDSLTIHVERRKDGLMPTQGMKVTVVTKAVQ